MSKKEKKKNEDEEIRPCLFGCIFTNSEMA